MDDIVSAGSIEDDVWLRPLDVRTKYSGCRRWWDAAFLICIFATVCLGIVTLISNDWSTADNEVFWYVVATLTFEAFCILTTVLGMASIVLLVGRTGLQHSLSFLSILNEVLFGCVHLCCAIWGGISLWSLLRSHQFEAKRLVTTADGDMLWHRVPLLLYVGLTFLVCLACSLQLLPWIFGAIGFALHQVQRKIQQVPIVEFYQQYNRGDEYYIRTMPVEDYAGYVTRMKNPLVDVDAHETQPLIGTAHYSRLESPRGSIV